MSRIFISYKRVDKDKVFKIKEQIESALGEKCWIDIDGIESDAQFASVIINAIDEAEIVLFMHSNAHTQISDFESDWTVRELNYAKEEGKKIVFLNIDKAPLTKWFKFMFPQKQQVDATSDNAMSKLFMDLRSWLNVHVPDNSKLSHQQIQSFSKEMVFPVGNVEFKMIHVEGGTFTMGEGSDAHQVTLSSYYIGETPVTQALWKEITGKTPSFFKGDQRPVESVSWNDCQEFIKKLNQKTGKKFSLLTEAEWEYAARGGKKSKGYEYAGSNDINEVAWYWKNSGERYTYDSVWDYDKAKKNKCQTHPVKQKKPNELGIYDMSGNVWEWCQDWYGVYKKGSQTNPTGPSSGSRRVVRGGGWHNDARDCRLAFRSLGSPGDASNGLGFRLALSEL